ncbi:MAG: FHA domain-containing protein [Planctomycetes bacterium]|nr:FHA domain-containing protein [Planctomycetota bacterium]
MKLSLVVMNAGKMEGQRIPITLPQFIIGRDPECNLRPASAVISKRHCAVISKDGQISVRDFDSTNGTFLNDNPVKGEAALKHNDVLKVGPLTFRVAMEIKPPGSKPTPPPTKSEADDESVAAMLLSLQEDGVVGGASTQGNESSVPAGSTVMDIVPFGQNQEGADKAAEEAKKKADAKKPPETAHVAAKAILDKYTRRSRR